jgi:hypothetical protein
MSLAADARSLVGAEIRPMAAQSPGAFLLLCAGPETRPSAMTVEINRFAGLK